MVAADEETTEVVVNDGVQFCTRHVQFCNISVSSVIQYRSMSTDIYSQPMN